MMSSFQCFYTVGWMTVGTFVLVLQKIIFTKNGSKKNSRETDNRYSPEKWLLKHNSSVDIHMNKVCICCNCGFLLGIKMNITTETGRERESISLVI